MKQKIRTQFYTVMVFFLKKKKTIMYPDGNIASSRHINLTFRMPKSRGKIKKS